MAGKKVQVPVIGGLRKVIAVTDNAAIAATSTTISEFANQTISLAQLKAALGITTSLTKSGAAGSASILVGPGLSGGGVVTGIVPINLVAPIPAFIFGDDGGGGGDGDPGPPGQNGATGASGPAGPAVYFLPDDPESALDAIPGQIGPVGSTGASGPLGPAVFMIGDDGEPGEPGPPGQNGTSGAGGVGLPDGLTVGITPALGTIGNSTGWGGFTLSCRINGARLLHCPTGWTVDFRVNAGSASATIGAAVIRRTLSGSITVIDTTNITWSGNNTPTLAVGTNVSDKISLLLDPSHDYYIQVYMTSATNPTLVTSTTPATWSLCDYGFASGNTTGSSLSSAITAYTPTGMIAMVSKGDTNGT